METSYKNLSDSELVTLAREGDQLAFRAIYEKYEKPLRSRLSNFFRWKADIDDVVTESFQKFFAKIDSFDSSRDILPWLYTIASRTAIDHLDDIRREDEKREGFSKKDAPEDGSQPLTEVNPEDEIISSEEHERLIAYIAEMDPKYGTIMHKYMIEELEYDEIARREGLPLNTVRTRIRRGKAKLAEMMLRGEVK
ncbi:MAG: RNA polymerase sigma factor [Bacteroidales bacterium]|nr:RNA polymerase sigma factor [Bacteroidales bacterium]